jgi:Flp pilus assembly protein TadG
MKQVGRLLRNRRGNVAIIVAFMAMVLCFALGMGVDYTLASRRRDQINGFADAAALAAVTPYMMTQTTTTAQAAAAAMFTSQLATVSNIAYTSGNYSIAVSQTTGATIVRTATISFTNVNSTNAFGALLKLASIQISGGSTATSSNAPNTNFFLLVDTSPSMEFPSTTAGIQTMLAHTPSQDGGSGCAIACHEYNPSADGLGNPGGEDNFALSRNLGVQLRIDLVNTSVTDLMQAANTTAGQNNTTYCTAVYTMDDQFGPYWPSAPSSSSSCQFSSSTHIPNVDLPASYDPAGPITAEEMFQNNENLVVPGNTGSSNNDQNTNIDGALTSILSTLPTAGNGTNNSGDTPQEILLIVSDGANDYSYNGNRSYFPVGTHGECTAVKNKGIRIAFLYLTYNPLTTDSWYTGHVEPVQFPGGLSSTDEYASAAQTCASEGLYTEVNTDGDISSALTALFEKAVATAHLIK